MVPGVEGIVPGFADPPLRKRPPAWVLWAAIVVLFVAGAAPVIRYVANG